jgi:hypothetical protein
MFIDEDGREWAEEYHEMLPALEQRSDLDSLVRELMGQDTPGKVTQGEGRLEKFRAVLTEVFDGELDLIESYREVEYRLPRYESMFSGDNRVFAQGWGERLVRTQVSRFYNQAVLLTLATANELRCYVPHSSAEKADSKCSLLLAGREHDAEPLLTRLVESYTMERWTTDVKVPNHPHCTHAITPPLAKRKSD